MVHKIIRKKTIGKIHSFESFGTLDGPGIRFVIFMAGCPLRCIYCHNIDIAMAKDAPHYTVHEVLKQILDEKEYLQNSGGGVTVTGGDPTLQIHYVVELFKHLQQEGIHTALDTSLMTTRANLNSLLPVTDLFLVSIKQLDEKKHLALTGASNKVIQRNIDHLLERTNHVWFRYVVLPGYTDSHEDIDRLKRFLRERKGKFELIELLPYMTLGVDKWKKLGLDYQLKGVTSPTQKKMEELKALLEKEGIKVKM